MNWELISSCLFGNASSEDISRLEQWRSASKENENAYQQTVKLWQSLDIACVSALDTKKSWEKVRAKANIQVEQVKILNFTPRILLRIAAIFILVFATALYFFYQKKDIHVNSQQTSLLNIELPDGSIADLYKNSQITYPNKFRSDLREVELSGEAFFQVTHNEKKPFIVKAGSAFVKVLGTSFNVAVNQNKQVEVIVNTGKVAVYANLDTVMLLPGDRAIYSQTSRSLSKSVNTDINFISWKTKKFTFRRTPVFEVFGELQKAYNITVSSDSSEINQDILTANFDNMPVKDVMNAISLTFGYTITWKGELVIVRKKT